MPAGHVPDGVDERTLWAELHALAQERDGKLSAERLAAVIGAKRIDLYRRFEPVAGALSRLKAERREARKAARAVPSSERADEEREAKINHWKAKLQEADSLNGEYEAR